MAYEQHPKIARMIPPERLKTEEYLPWSGGRGIDVWTMLCAAIAGDLETIKQLVAKDPGLVNCALDYYTPLRFAVRENHRHVVDFLLEQGVSAAYEAGDHILTIARDRGYTELAAFFESKLKDNFHIAPEGALTAAAIKAFDANRVRTLLENNPGLLQSADERGNQPIHWAVMTRQIDLIDHLLSLGADINAMRPDGARPLDLTGGDYHYRSWYRDPAALKKHDVVTGYLMARGAYLDISVASKIGHAGRVRELLDEDPGLVNRIPPYCGYYSGLPLRCAAAAGQTGIVQLLLERGANPNEPEPGIAPRGGALHAAISGKHFAIVKLLLEHGADPNAEVESSGNCIWMAKSNGSPPEIIQLIASYGGARNVDLVCHDNDVETLSQMLLVNPKLPFDGPPQHQQCAELLFRYQPEVIQKGVLGTDNPDYARWLIEHGLDPGRCNWLGIAPLHHYAEKGDINMAAVCLEYGADINPVDTDYSSTPLGWAARFGRKEMVEWLLEKGADPHLPVEEPWALPLAWARRRGHREIVELLS